MPSSSDDKSIRSGHYENATVDDDQKKKDPFFFSFLNVFVYFSPQQLHFQDSLCISSKGEFLALTKSSLAIYRICQNFPFFFLLSKFPGDYRLTFAKPFFLEKLALSTVKSKKEFRHKSLRHARIGKIYPNGNKIVYVGSVILSPDKLICTRVTSAVHAC